MEEYDDDDLRQQRASAYALSGIKRCVKDIALLRSKTKTSRDKTISKSRSHVLEIGELVRYCPSSGLRSSEL